MSALDPQEMVPAIHRKNVQQKGEQMMDHVPLALEFAASSHCHVEIHRQKIKHTLFSRQQPP